MLLATTVIAFGRPEQRGNQLLQYFHGETTAFLKLEL
jgi:hypothetical protein